jgi:hypothetical protein
MAPPGFALWQLPHIELVRQPPGSRGSGSGVGSPPHPRPAVTFIHVNDGRPVIRWRFGRIFLAVSPIEPTRAVIDVAPGNRLEQTCRAQPLFALKGGKGLGKSRAEVQVLGSRAIVPAKNS